MSVTMWILWGLVLIAQNFAFTFVSRARNSGSLKKHLIAGFFSNGVWFVGQLFAVGAFMSILAGHYGVPLAIFAGLYYTAFTLTGSLLAHHYALKTEKGSSRVGSHKDVATFTKEQGDILRNNIVTVSGKGFEGTFTIEEISKLKDLIGTSVVETVQVQDELLNISTPEGTGAFQPVSEMRIAGPLTSPSWQPTNISALPSWGGPGQGAKL